MDRFRKIGVSERWIKPPGWQDDWCDCELRGRDVVTSWADTVCTCERCGKVSRNDAEILLIARQKEASETAAAFRDAGITRVDAALQTIEEITAEGRAFFEKLEGERDGWKAVADAFMAWVSAVAVSHPDDDARVVTARAELLNEAKAAHARMVERTQPAGEKSH